MQPRTERKLVFALFLASGISGLIYEVVWLRILSRITGVTTYATAITVAAFMAGLGLGSFIFGKFIDKRKDQLRIYALLQLSVAVIAVVTPILLKISIPLYKYIHEISNQNVNLIIMVRILVSFVSLLIPTTLMGGTLPVLTSYMVKKEGLFGKNFSLLYGLNTLGAVFGVILSGFITIGTLGEWNTIFIGVLINFMVGGIALSLHKKALGFTEETKVTEDKFIAPTDAPISPYPDVVRKIVLIAILISGFTALAYEVIWTRQLILFLETSIYAFSAMLAVFLAGIAIGSIFINKYVDTFKAPVFVFGVLELLVGALSILNLYFFGLLDGHLLSRILSPVVLVFPLTLLFGAIFPVAALCYTKSLNRTGFSVGTLYSFNTIGNVTGALLTGFLLIGLLGSSKTVVLLSFVNVTLGIILLWSEPNKSNRLKLKYLLAVPAVICLAIGFKGKDPFLNVIEKRVSSGARSHQIFHNRETIQGTVTSFIKNASKRLWINGVGQTVLVTETKLMAHLPILLSKEPKEFLVICFGMGTTLKSASVYDGLKITSVELVPEVYKCFKYYHDEAETLLSRKNLKLVAEDGRNFLLLSSDKYDVITVDPSPPIHSAGTVNLYTREFFSLCKNHMTPDGVTCLWFPGSHKSDTLHIENSLYILKTFYSVFPNMTVWRGPHNWGFYIVGTLAETRIDKSKIEQAFKNPRLVKDLSEYDSSCVTSSQLLNLLVLQDKNHIEDATRNASIITDNFPYTEFPLWRYLLHHRKHTGHQGSY
jgi:spermidine synthase